MARLDRLGPAKEVMQTGAVIGSEFSYELLHAVHPLAEEELQGSLRRLADADLIYAQGIPPKASYIFKHALIRDAAYEALLKSRRRQLHARIAGTLEGQFPELVSSQPEVVARHYTEAELVSAALPYWQRAGQLAVERSANLEAIDHLTRGIELSQDVVEVYKQRVEQAPLDKAEVFKPFKLALLNVILNGNDYVQIEKVAIASILPSHP